VSGETRNWLRATVVELPHDPRALEQAWEALGEHTRTHGTELLLLPELAFVEALWENEVVDDGRRQSAERLTEQWLQRLPELGATAVVGARPVRRKGTPTIEAFRWRDHEGTTALRSKQILPNEPNVWEGNWFARGEDGFPAFQEGGLRFGVNLCSELWALETFADYAARGVQAVLSPRATAAATQEKWLAVGRVAATRSGAYSLSSNRVDPTGTYGGGAWILDPDGRLLALTDADRPFATVALDLSAPAAAKATYPRTLFPV
jgi:N-carbamoylputrescine amidase